MANQKRKDVQKDIDFLKRQKAEHERQAKAAEQKLKEKQIQQQRLRREGQELELESRLTACSRVDWHCLEGGQK